MATSVLTISGSTIARPTAGIVLDKFKLNLDGPTELEFREVRTTLPGTFAPENAVSLTIGSTVVFVGNIYGRYPSGAGTGVISVGYRCLDVRYAANLIAITASDGTGTMTFNLPSTNQNYIASEAGLSVGAILTQVFNQHAAQLTADGITAFNSGDLANLTVVPPEPVYITGNRLWSQVDQLLQTWYGSRYVSYMEPTSTTACTIRILDSYSFTPATLTLGVDPVILDSINEDTTECYSAVELRGRDDVESAYLSLSNGTLVDPNAPAGTNLEASWTLADFLNPPGGYSNGTIGSMSSTTLTITSAVAGEAHAANYWSGIEATVWAINAAGSGVALQEERRVTASTSYTAGSPFTVTLDIPLANSGYTTYQMRGTPPGISTCYRELAIPDSYINQHLVQQFNYAVNWSPMQLGVTQTWFPVGVVLGTSAGISWEFPLTFQTVPYNGFAAGSLLCYQPWVQLFNSNSNLIAGGSAVQQATDIQVLVAYSRGTMTAVYPSSGFSGLAFTRFNVQRTLIRDYVTWWDQGNQSNMNILAEQIWNTVSQPVIEGQMTYIGQYLTPFTPGSPMALNIANYFGTTTYESLDMPVRSATLEWNSMGQGAASPWTTRINFSTRRQQYSADRLYNHSNWGSGGPLQSQGGSTFSTSVAGLPTGSMFTNADIGSSNEFTPVFNAQEIAAGNRMMGQEAGAAGRMGAAENDPRQQQALTQNQRAEQRAADELFGQNGQMF